MNIAKNAGRVVLAVFTILVLASPWDSFAATTNAAAKTSFYYAGWVPYWKKQAGAMDTALNLDKFQEISPFSYEVGANGAFKDALKIKGGFWPTWLSAARDMNIKIIPTVAWFDGDGIHALLSNTKKRIAHENAIAKLVKDNKFDGVDIDYESKLAETNQYFSTFIYGLALRLHPMGKKLSCTIEPRIPALSRYSYTGTPDDYQYANDYATLNKYCDEVRIMTYDQGLIDIDLDSTKGNRNLYAPVADADWAAKVLALALKQINPKKIMLGIPTYGYEYQVRWNSGILTYERLRADTFIQAMNRADNTNSTPVRNNAGELSFTYTTSTYVADVSTNLSWSIGSNMPQVFAAQSQIGMTTRYVSFTDSVSASKLIALAKKLGLRGVVFFKWDGDQDPLIWQIMMK